MLSSKLYRTLHVALQGPNAMWVASKASKHPASTPRVCSNARRARCQSTRTRQHTAAAIGLKRSHTHSRSRRCSDLRPQAISSAAAVAGAGVAVAAAAAAALQNRRPSGGAHRCVRPPVHTMLRAAYLSLSRRQQQQNLKSSAMH